MPSIVCPLIISLGSNGYFPSNDHIDGPVKLNGSQDQVKSHELEERTCRGEEGLIGVGREKEGVEERVTRVHLDLSKTVQIHLMKEEKRS